MVIVLGGVYRQHHTYDHDGVSVVVKAYLVPITFAEYDAVLSKGCDLTISLKDGIPETLMPEHAVAEFVTLALENSLPSLLTPEMKDSSIQECEVIFFSEE